MKNGIELVKFNDCNFLILYDKIMLVLTIGF
jgi:hypothetical protein